MSNILSNLFSAWLQKHFTEELENFKHNLNKLLEEKKTYLQQLTDKRIRYHEKEFTNLYETWKLLQIAIINIDIFMASYKTSIKISSLNSDDIKNLFREKNLSHSEINSIMKSDDQDIEYYKVMRFKEYVDAYNSTIDLIKQIRINSIFINESLSLKLSQTADILQDIISRYQSQVSIEPEFRAQTYPNALRDIRDEFTTIKQNLWEIKDQIKYSLFEIDNSIVKSSENKSQTN